MKTVLVSKALVLDLDGHMLLLRRSSTHPTLAGRRDLPGGLIDEGEEPGEAAIREIHEETGLVVSLDQLQLLYTGTEAYHDESRVRLLYMCSLRAIKPVVQISWEHESAEWVDVTELGEIETDFHSFYHDALQYVREHKLLVV